MYFGNPEGTTAGQTVHGHALLSDFNKVHIHTKLIRRNITFAAEGSWVYEEKFRRSKKFDVQPAAVVRELLASRQKKHPTGKGNLRSQKLFEAVNISRPPTVTPNCRNALKKSVSQRTRAVSLFLSLLVCLSRLL
jgi:hypothetical protein